jgi:hypothetical protein
VSNPAFRPNLHPFVSFVNAEGLRGYQWRATGCGLRADMFRRQ